MCTVVILRRLSVFQATLSCKASAAIVDERWVLIVYRYIVGRRIVLTGFLVGMMISTAISPNVLAAPNNAPNRAPNSSPLLQSAADPLVLAFYYTWFDENSWSYDQLSDLPAERYISRDRGVMGRQIDQAKAAGIDAFLVAWYGPGGDNQTEPNLAALLEEAAARNFKIGILFETDSPFLGGVGAITGALQHALSVHANQPAFLRVDGRPVIFFWRPTIYGVESWRAIRNQVDPGYGSIWIAEGVDTSYLAVFDGHHLYSNTWNPPADLGYTNQKFAGQVAQARQNYGAYKFWVATVMPGYNDLRIRPNSGFAKDREGGAYYERSWQAAIGSQPNWVVITSFNEWPEGTYIEPSAAYGGQYLGVTAAWSGQFKAGGGQEAAAQPVAVEAFVAAAAAPAPTATPFPEPAEPTAYIQTPLLNLRAGPGTEGYAIIGQMTEGNALLILGRDSSGEWWQVQDGDSVAWLASAYVYAAGPLDTIPVIAMQPEISLKAAAVETVSDPAAIVPPLAEVDTVTDIVTDTTEPLAQSSDGAGSEGIEEAEGVEGAYQPTLLPSPTPPGPPTYHPKLSRNP